MSDFTNWGENLVCQIVTGGTVALPETLHVGLLQSADDETLTEVSWQGYTRVPLPRQLDTWSGTQGATSTGISNGSSRAIYNLIDFDFGVAAGEANVTALGIYAGNNPLCYVILDVPIAVNTDDDVKVAAGTVSLTISTVGGLTDFATNELLDYLYRGIPHSFTNHYLVGLYVVVPSLAGGGTEVSGRGYGRAQVQMWTAPDAGVITNSELVQFAAPTGAWGTVKGAGLTDLSGNLRFVTAFQSAKTIPAGAAAPRFPVNKISITVQ